MIRLEHVAKVHAAGSVSVPALTDVSFSVAKGDFVVLSGGGGADKTTLLRLLYREDLPTEGEIEAAGFDVTRLRRRDIPRLRRAIGIVFQDPRLLTGRTVFENVAFVLRVLGLPRGEITPLTLEALRAVGLSGRAQAYPAQLSQGEAQRASLARAIVKSPALLLADEPTGEGLRAARAGRRRVPSRVLRDGGGPRRAVRPEGPRSTDEDAVAVPITGALDLHLFAPREIPSVVEEDVRACRERGVLRLRLAHGRGKGMQRAVVRRVLASLPEVLSFEDAPPLAGALGDIPGRLARYPLADLRIAHTISYEENANWKVLCENYNECYHCGPVHPELCRIVPSFREGATTFTFTGESVRRSFPGLNEDEQTRHKGELLYPNLFLSLARVMTYAAIFWRNLFLSDR